MQAANGSAKRDVLLNELLALMDDLPDEQLVTVTQLVRELHAGASRGSAQAIHAALDQAGVLQFAPGELDQLLAELEDMRRQEMDEHE